MIKGGDGFPHIILHIVNQYTVYVDHEHNVCEMNGVQHVQCTVNPPPETTLP